MEKNLPTLRIGTRGSPLALAQAYETRSRLSVQHKIPEEDFEIVVIKTSGDKIQDRPLAAIGGKGLFTKEIEEALLDDRIDCAVHSMKDMPVHQPEGLSIECILPREDVRDAFLTISGEQLSDLNAGDVVGTSSLRRRAQLLKAYPDFKVVEFRGNVQTRLKKLEDGVAKGTFLAMAGLSRLGLLETLPVVPISVDTMLPAVAQGAIGIECRTEDEETRRLFEPLNHLQTENRLKAERAFLEGLDGSCQTPIAALAQIEGDALRLRGEVIRPDGSESFFDDVSGPVQNAAELGFNMADKMKRKMGENFFS